MWLVARLAIDAVGVIDGYHLGKLPWLGRAGFVATHAQLWSFRENGLYANVVGVLGLGPMAGFAVHSAMRAGGKLVVLVGVTGLANGPPGKGNLPLADIAESWTPVKPVLAKSGGDSEKSESEKSKDS